METAVELYFGLVYLLGTTSFTAISGIRKYFLLPKLTLLFSALYVILTVDSTTGPGGLGSLGRPDLLLLTPPVASAAACLLLGILVNKIKQNRIKPPEGDN